MQSSLIGKIQKAKIYATEPERVKFTDFSVKFHGDHNNYITSFKDGQWHCTCDFFQHTGTCSHTMAMEKILGVMLPEEAVTLP